MAKSLILKHGLNERRLIRFLVRKNSYKKKIDNRYIPGRQAVVSAVHNLPDRPASQFRRVNLYRCILNMRWPFS